MKLFAIAAMAAALPVIACGSASAQSQGGMMHGVQHAGAKARCSPGDPNVMVNTKTKTYMLDKSAKTSMMKPGAAKSAMGDEAAAGAGASGMHSMKTSMVSMCKSEAVGMGAKMMSGTHKADMHGGM